MTARIEALERLEKLRQSGALSEAEFEAEKARLMTDDRPVPPLATPAISQQSRRSPNWVLISILGAAVALIAITFGVTRASRIGATPVGNSQVPVAGTASTTTAMVPDAQAAPDDPSAALRAIPADQQTKLAFRAVFGRDAPVVTKGDNGDETIQAVKVIWTPRGPVLITSTAIADGCHACAGSLGVYYLKAAGQTFEVTARYPKAVQGWGWGTVPEWKLTDKFTDNPAIYSEGGYSGQGVSCSGASLTELRPDGPVQSDQIWTGGDNMGNVDEDTGKTFGGDPAYNYEGKIANIVKGKSFDVQVTGTKSFTERYVLQGKKFVRVGGESRLAC